LQRERLGEEESFGPSLLASVLLLRKGEDREGEERFELWSRRGGVGEKVY